MRAAATPAVIEATEFSKQFGGRTVLDAVDLTIRRGEVHALLGQNGSGKSTLIKILAGVYRPEDGAGLSLGGEPVHLPMRPGGARKLGVAFVHQDLGLLPSGTVLENLRIGQYDTGRGWRIAWRKEAELARERLADFGLEIDPETRVEELRDVDRALLALVRALDELRSHPGGLLVLDEPTAYLPRDGVDQLFAAVRQAAKQGFGVLFVTHRLEEVMALADTVSVLRDGKLAWRGKTADVTEDELIENILGFSLGQLYPEHHETVGQPVATIEGLTGSTLTTWSTTLHRGEIVGVTGLLGMGYDEIPYLLFGARDPRGGRLRVGEDEIDVAELTPRAAMGMGVALLPADRLRKSGIGSATVLENATMPTLSRYFRGGLLRHGQESALVGGLLRDFAVQPPFPDAALRTLSGGNQQKVLVGKWFQTQPKVFVMHEATQGVDVGAKRQIFQQIRSAADDGTSFLLASAEYEDLANLCDRVIVFRNGVVVGELSGGHLSANRILDQCFRDSPPSGNSQQSTQATITRR